MKSNSSSVIALAICSALFAAPVAIAQEAAPAAPTGLTLELNNARDVNGVCRLTYIAYNGTTTALDETSYEVVVFDSDSRVSQFLILEFGSLPVEKTKVVQFDIGDSECSGITRLLVNNVSKCTSGGQTLPICLDTLTTTSRTPIAFGL